MPSTDVSLSRQIAHHKGRLAVATRDRDKTAQAEARRAMNAAKIAQYVEKTLADAPPLTDAQADEIVAIIGRHTAA
ncbi:hypothetical protein [Nocardia farcinica]|uniref:hypothetical protein n=1 Tax=Nocardia farcinica TaxID=37329 RepID=UPI0024563A1B|nr:hypothetical protein [Nocardia farcinica]